MKLPELKEKYTQDQRIISIANQFRKSTLSHVHIKNIAGSVGSFIAYGLSKSLPVHQFIILPDKEEAAYFLNDLESLVGERALFYPASYRRAYEIEKTDNANIQLRAEVLNKVSAKEQHYFIVSYPDALSEFVVTEKDLLQHTLEVHQDDKLSIEFLVETLNDYGFERVDFVGDPGQFAVRGGIIDIYSFANENPYRIEFFGDEIESIRLFDPATQLSVKKLSHIAILPNIQRRITNEKRVPILDFMPKNTIFWFKDFNICRDQVAKSYQSALDSFEKLNSPLNHLAPAQQFISKEVFIQSSLHLNTIEFGQQFYFKEDFSISFNTNPQPVFNKNFELLSQNLNDNTESGIQNIIIANNAKQIERLYSIFEDIGKEIQMETLLLSLHEGFIDKSQGVAIYTDHQIFDRYHRFRLKESFKQKDQAITLKELNNLVPGDFITHIDHGVGKFSGLEKITVDGKQQEAIRILYNNNDILYISIHSLHRISKFVSKDGTPPKIDRLGSDTWKKLKQKTKTQVKQIAFDLIKLYAERKTKKGFAFSPDTYMQNELEASFLYEDTPDQFKATQDVKADLESETPMDRLICGDVGFGKTEIAVRAAFKAVADNKQVAILVPTTILAWQHYQTFKSRLKDFPAKVDYINRFKTRKQQTETLKNLAEGKVDILIGTHRIVGKDVKFKDLGLLIIDEEQKFGVGVKDKLKTLKVDVDTLTLTATPIPRTLQFSLMQARDLSVINTPPPNRQPILTEVHTFNEELIRDVISYEIARGGQVFFINNRVQNIQEVAGMIARLVPEARVLIGHGQMKGEELEERMMAFINGEYDVLVATTIIESGLDIPNANTIIINNANNFGLSDLHQMRGRVGRSNKKAFCYLLAPPMVSLSSEARKRLQAIEQFSDLGSGFQIAMKDLDIRGAGNLLGAEQSGFISEIGFDMYQKILNEAIQELKETEFKDMYDELEGAFVQDCLIETDLEILIPDDYVSNIAERIHLYKELDGLEKESELDQFENQLIDRFGPIPPATQEMIRAIKLRWIAKDIGLEKVVLKQQKLICYFVSNQDSPYYQSAIFTKVLTYVQMNPTRCKLKERNGRLSLVYEHVRSIVQAIELLGGVLEKERVY
ncbi:MAG: transcription-repair coupling factor [Bacteroidetes bacterium]|nr:transcription-repair coupling factor [Bacteroidota bacterium]NOG56688.1 transcription-repair coupling factor [Bacteroidota bacterium]